MPTQDVDRITRHAHARPRNQPAIDRIAHGDIGASSALGAHVALGGEARHHVGLGRAAAISVRCGTDSSTVCRSSFPGCRKRCVCASISPGISVVSPRSITTPRRMRDRASHLADALADDQHFARRETLPAATSSSRAACSLSGDRSGNGERQEGSGKEFHRASRILHPAA
jgi:hypothetical protein